MTGRIDRAARLIRATPAAIYAAFIDPVAYATWLPPAGMSVSIARFEPHPGGAYRLTLRYAAGSEGKGKSSADADTVDGHFVALVPGEQIVQTAMFESDDPAFAGTMRMSWALTPAAGGTEVTITATDVPPGISAVDHATGLQSTLANLAAFVE
ncbi:MAG: SRPBCC family protein [Pseudomonadota bacterium]|nr:SRPBCC family protein [Pseudomonadota bacterium]